MAKITEEEVRHVAELARLNIPEDQLGSFTLQMNQILGYMEKLNKLDTDSVEPTSHPVPLDTAWREDAVKPSLDPDKALSNAPERQEQLIVVPKIIE